MITKRRINIPIFNYKLTIIIYDKWEEVKDLISDDNGNIDIEGILSEITENLMTTQPFIFKAPYIGDVEIGGGTIGFSIPLTDKKLVFDTTDLESFKEMLITKE